MEPTCDAAVWNIVFTLIALAIGSVITWSVSTYHYERAAVDLKDEAAELRRHLRLLIDGVQQLGVEFIRDAAGKTVALKFNMARAQITEADDTLNATASVRDKTKYASAAVRCPDRALVAGAARGPIARSRLPEHARGSCVVRPRLPLPPPAREHHRVPVLLAHR